MDSPSLTVRPQREFLHKDLTQKIIGASFEVYNHLGYGYLEKVYQRALQVELLQHNLKAKLEHPIQVRYKGAIVGDYSADLFVEERVLVELKVAPEYCSADEAQLLNELVSTGVEVGLLINFGKERVEFKRLALSKK
jgi:GxxExxY protein